jgi:hypothetical protein
LPSWFAKLLEGNFSRFAKIRWMPSWFAKLLKLLLHQNPEGETKLCLCPSTSSKLTSGTLKWKQNYFYVLPPLVIWRMRTDRRAHISACWGSFCQLGINGNLGWGIVGEMFFYFC